MKLPAIDGKEIVPLRLIPFITNSIPGLATLFGILANRLNFVGDPYEQVYEQQERIVHRYIKETGCSVQEKEKYKTLSIPKDNNGMDAYRLDVYDVPVKISLSEWDQKYLAIKGTNMDYLYLREFRYTGDPVLWRLKVSKSLPSGVFLWRDELDSSWQGPISRVLFPKINLDIYIKSEYLDFACEGLEDLMQTGEITPSAVMAETPGEQPTQETIEEACNRLVKGGLGKEEIAYTLFNMGFQNNMIGVALGLTYKKGKNDVVAQVVRWRKKHEKTLGG